MCIFSMPSASVKKVEKIYIFPESGSGKHFQFSAMRAIDFSHDFTPKNSKILSYNRIFEKYGFFWNTLYKK